MVRSSCSTLWHTIEWLPRHVNERAVRGNSIMYNVCTCRHADGLKIATSDGRRFLLSLEKIMFNFMKQNTVGRVHYYPHSTRIASERGPQCSETNKRCYLLVRGRRVEVLLMLGRHTYVHLSRCHEIDIPRGHVVCLFAPDEGRKAHGSCDSRKLRAEVVPDVKGVPEEEEARHLQSADPRTAGALRRLRDITARRGCRLCFWWDSGGYSRPCPSGRYHSRLRCPRTAAAVSPRRVASSPFVPWPLPAATQAGTTPSGCREAADPHAQEHIRCEHEKGSSVAPSGCSSVTIHPPPPPYHSRW